MPKRKEPRVQKRPYAIARDRESGALIVLPVAISGCGRGRGRTYSYRTYEARRDAEAAIFVEWIGFVDADSEQEAIANVAQARP